MESLIEQIIDATEADIDLKAFENVSVTIEQGELDSGDDGWVVTVNGNAYDGAVVRFLWAEGATVNQALRSALQEVERSL